MKEAIETWEGERSKKKERKLTKPRTLYLYITENFYPDWSSCFALTSIQNGAFKFKFHPLPTATAIAVYHWSVLSLHTLIWMHSPQFKMVLSEPYKISAWFLFPYVDYFFRSLISLYKGFNMALVLFFGLNLERKAEDALFPFSFLFPPFQAAEKI